MRDTSCIWCGLDGRAGCPLHYRRSPRLLAASVLVVLVMLLLVALW